MNRILRDSDDSPMLFRGDAGLPPGVVPASPQFQFALRCGRSLDQAFEQCRLWVRIAADRDRDGDTDIAELVEDSTHLQGPWNPFVSTTTSYATAKAYALAGADTATRPYITAILPYEASRATDFRTHLNVTTKSRRNREVGITGVVFPEEVLFRAYIDELDREAEARIAKLSPARLLASNIPIIPERDLTPTFDKSYACRACGHSLPYYFRRNLGQRCDAIQIFDASSRNVPFCRGRKRDKNHYLAAFVSRRPTVVDVMAEIGLICRCMHCETWLHTYQPQSAPLVRASVKSSHDSVWSIAVENLNQQPLTVVFVGLHLSQGDEVRHMIARFNFGPGAQRIDTYWPGLARALRRNAVPSNVIRRMFQSMLRQNPMIAAGSSMTLEIPVLTSEETCILRDVSIVRAHFESGEMWAPASAFDIEWESFL